MRNLTFNSINSLDKGVAISGEGSYDAPSRDISSYTIPGRNGTLLYDNGRFNNITVSYPAFVISNMATSAADIRAWLMTPTTYARLEDDYHTDEFRLAIFSGTINFDTTAWNQHAEFTIKFNCKPQRFLKSGETATAVANNGTITNPTQFTSLPIISVTGTGSGTITVNGTTVTLEDLAGGIVLDCDTQDAYYGLDPMNANMTGDFPTLSPGSNSVSFTGGVTAVSITPRWWRI